MYSLENVENLINLISLDGIQQGLFYGFVAGFSAFIIGYGISAILNIIKQK